MNDQQIMMQMEVNVGRRCSFDVLDSEPMPPYGHTVHGTVAGVSNSEHYRVSEPRNGYLRDWYVRAESIRLE